MVGGLVALLTTHLAQRVKQFPVPLLITAAWREQRPGGRRSLHSNPTPLTCTVAPPAGLVESASRIV